MLKICRDSGSSWQAKEGAVMGLNVIVRRFQWVASSGGDEAQLSNSQPYMKVKLFGKLYPCMCSFSHTMDYYRDCDCDLDY